VYYFDSSNINGQRSIIAHVTSVLYIIDVVCPPGERYYISYG